MIKIKDSIYILEESDDKYIVIQTSTREIIRFEVDELVKQTLNILSIPHRKQDVISKLSMFNSNDVISCIVALENAGILREYDLSNIKPRVHKQVLFLDELTSSWEETICLQKKFESTPFLIFGVGGIGSWMVNSLYQMGAENITISDPDVVSETNLNRQLYFTHKDVGKFKVDVLKQKIIDINLNIHRFSISPEQSLDDIIERSKFIVNCADFPSVADTSKIIDLYANKYSIPYLVSGGYNMHLGMVGPIIVPGKSATFDDFLTYQKNNDALGRLKVIKDVNQTGSMGPISGAIANIQAMEIYKFITGKGVLNINRFAEINFLDLGIEWRNFA